MQYRPRPLPALTVVAGSHRRGGRLRTTGPRCAPIPGVTYDAIGDAGLQLPHRGDVHAHLIGGASVAADLDAKRAIRGGPSWLRRSDKDAGSTGIQ